MAQFARPDTDVTLNNWSDDGGGNTNIFQAIDEVSFSDTDFVRSPNNPASSAFYEPGLSNPTDPVSSTGHIVRYRYRKSGSGGRTIQIQVALYQGATQIAIGTAHTDISGTFVAGTFTLTGTEADNITDYTDLRLRFVAGWSGSGAGRRAHVSWAELEMPDAPGGGDTDQLATLSDPDRMIGSVRAARLGGELQ